MESSEACKKTVRILKLIDRGTLVRNQALAIHKEFVLLGLASKNGMVFENQALRVRAAWRKKEEGGSESADSATDDNATFRFLPCRSTFFGSGS